MEKKYKKKVLFIAPLFFGYYKDIIKQLEILNYDVTYVCDTANNSNISKALGRINKKNIRRSTRKYFNNVVIAKIKEINFDCVLVVAGMTFAFDEKMVATLKTMNSKAKFILYQWDSERNLPYCVSIHKYFEKSYSFDRYDSKDVKYKFLPLFYTDEYENISLKNNSNYKYDCSYVGTAHPQKYKYINEMSQELNGIMKNQKIYHYMPSKLKFIYHKFLDKEFKNAKFDEFETEKLSSQEVAKIFIHSKCILDAPQKGQTGLTIRTIECLGARKKLITTNKDIVNYDFYREENIYVYDGVFDFNSRFFTSDYVDLPNEMYQKYSLRNWLKTILE